MSDMKIQPVFEGENFSIYRVEDEEGDIGFDVNFFDNVTVHFLAEEWDEFLDVIQSIDFGKL